MLDICVVLVTYNRVEKLKKALAAYQKQTALPKYLIVVNNASNDDTVNYLKEWSKEKDDFLKIVINLEDNIGGSGGFYYGEKKALELGTQWIMVADDDAYPNVDYLEGLMKYINRHNADDYAVVCGKVIEYGNCVNVHRRFLRNKWKRIFYTSVPLEYFNKNEFEFDFASYVGILINKDKMLQVGTIDKSYFIWNDDVEHSCRLHKVGKIVCVPSYTIIHDADVANYELSWKDYYGYRNNMCILKKYFKLQFPFILCVTIIKAILCPLHGKSLTEVKLRLAAMRDAIFCNMGKNKKYKPGWKSY